MLYVVRKRKKPIYTKIKIKTITKKQDKMKPMSLTVYLHLSDHLM